MEEGQDHDELAQLLRSSIERIKNNSFEDVIFVLDKLSDQSLLTHETAALGVDWATALNAVMFLLMLLWLKKYSQILSKIIF